MFRFGAFRLLTTIEPNVMPQSSLSSYLNGVVYLADIPRAIRGLISPTTYNRGRVL